MLPSRHMGQSIVVVDAFAEQPFTGNPAAVCVLDQPADVRWMQLVAREMNLSETAFLFPEGDAFRLRWFTPTTEVDLCGHATLASAHVLWEDGVVPPDKSLCFMTRSGELRARQADGWIELDFPSKPATAADAPQGLLEALGVQPVFIGRSAFDYLVEVASEGVVRSITPNFELLKRLSVRGIIVTARSSSASFDFVSRFFAPAAGVNEDPVTGSAHCTLAPFWQGRLGKSEMSAYQASARGGVLTVAVRDGRVLLRGHAVMMSRVEMLCAFG